MTESPSALAEQNLALDREIKETLERRIAESTARELPSPETYIWNRTHAELLQSARDAGIGADLLELGVPTDRAMAEREGIDWAVNTIRAARDTGENPVELAEKLGTVFAQHPAVASAEAAGPFLNLKFDYGRFAPETLGQVDELGPDYGRFRKGDPTVTLVDYSGPNIAKNMTLAHLRSTIIGESVAHVSESAGETVFRVNHLGDWGTQFGKIIYEYQDHLAEEGETFKRRIEADPASVLLELYREFVAFEDAIKDNPELEDKAAREKLEAAQRLFLQLEQGDPELTALWNQFREWSLEAFAPVYDRLRIEFDAMQGESFYEDRMMEVVEEGLAKGVLERDPEGAVVFPAQPLFDPDTGEMSERAMEGKDGNPRNEIILKPSGGTVYLTRDLAAIRYRTQELGVDRIFYVVGKEQKGHFRMLFAMAEQLGYAERGQVQHLDFGHLNVDGKKMKSRKGKVVLLDDILDEAVEAAEELIIDRKEDKAAGLTDEERETARRVGIAAVEFNDLRQDRRSDIEFTPEIAKTLESGGSPYIQYAYSRLRSIQRKASEKGIDGGVLPTEIPGDLSVSEKAVIRRLAEFPDVISVAASKRAPHRVSMYLSELAKELNTFYRENPVLSAPEGTRSFRLAIVDAARQVVENAAVQVHIELPDRM